MAMLNNQRVSVLNFSKAFVDRLTPATAAGTHISGASAGMQITVKLATVEPSVVLTYNVQLYE